jgi:dihydrofolate reductase/thymidylate synthase
MKRTFSIIGACIRSTGANNWGIGFKNELPWPKLSKDMKFFAKQTTTVMDNSKSKSKSIYNSVIMGRNTWDSIPDNFKPLSDRLNIVVSSNTEFLNNLPQNKLIHGTNSIENALDFSYSRSYIENTFVIGGQTIWDQTINHPELSKIYLTRIETKDVVNVKDNILPIKCDTFFPKMPKWMILNSDLTNRAKEHSDSKDFILEFEVFENKSHPKSDELQYTSLLKTIIKDGENKDGRNGHTLSTFGTQHIFDLQDGFPLLTTKRMFFPGIVKELLFFLRGETNANILSKDNVKIWDGNTTRDFLDSRGLTHYSVGDMGPMYGFNWRHFGAKYYGMNGNYSDLNKGHDQLYDLVKSLTNDPNSRRHLLTTFDPSTVKNSVLAPCHGLTIQFNIRNGLLDCKMYQRSVDVALGYPFNIASYGLLVHILCHITGLKPGKLVMTLGDTHLYKNHIEKVTRQIKRIPLVKPTLELTKEFNVIGTTVEDKIKFIENLSCNDFKLSNYNYWPGIKMKMVV